MYVLLLCVCGGALLGGGGGMWHTCVINGCGIRVYIPRVYICFAVLPTYCNLKRFTEAELVDIFKFTFFTL